MAITTKQRAYLRAQANQLETIFQIGKSGVSRILAEQVGQALAARELIKLRVLENSGLSPKNAAAELAEQTGAEVVQVIGTRFVLYRKNTKNPKIMLEQTGKK